MDGLAEISDYRVAALKKPSLIQKIDNTKKNKNKKIEEFLTIYGQKYKSWWK